MFWGYFSKKTYTRPVSEAVNTLPFHGRGASSILARDANIHRGMGERFNPEHLKCSDLKGSVCSNHTSSAELYSVSYALMLFIQLRGPGRQNASDPTQIYPPCQFYLAGQDPVVTPLELLTGLSRCMGKQWTARATIV